MTIPVKTKTVELDAEQFVRFEGKQLPSQVNWLQEHVDEDAVGVSGTASKHYPDGSSEYEVYYYVGQ